MKKWFSMFSAKTAQWSGSYMAFIAAMTLTIVWFIYAIPHKFDANSQMPINTFTTVVTFLMVFLIQNAQNRDSKATHLKLDELIRSSKARNKMILAEDFTDEELEKAEKELKDLPQPEQLPK